MDTLVASCRLLRDEKIALDNLAKRKLVTPANLVATILRQALLDETNFQIYDATTANRQPWTVRCPYPEGDPRRDEWISSDVANKEIHPRQVLRVSSKSKPSHAPRNVISLKDWVTNLRLESTRLCPRGMCGKCDTRWPLVYRVIADPPRSPKDLVPLLELERNNAKKEGVKNNEYCKNK